MPNNAYKPARMRVNVLPSRLVLIQILLLLVLIEIPGLAQGTFNSGSTGADGAFNPTINQTIQLPESGVFNFTTVNIPSGVTIKFLKNSRNTPVTILASGDIVINGAIDISGEGGKTHGGGAGGPGGFNGGVGGYGYSTPPSGTNGDGPGGGKGGLYENGVGIGAGGGGGFSVNGGNGQGAETLLGIGGVSYSSSNLLPLIGGAGGGGGSGNPGQFHGGSGGGGGGAILIAGSTSITFNSGVIYANGGVGSSALNGCFAGCVIAGSGGGGSGGAIRLVSNVIAGRVDLFISGGGGGTACYCGVFGCHEVRCGYSGGTGAAGYVRIEAFDISTFNLFITPASPTSFSSALPKPAVLANMPQLAIISVGGVAAPAAPKGSLTGVPDITVPTTQPNPVSVAITANNIPLNTAVQVAVTPDIGASTIVAATPLSGTEASSTTTASVNLPNGMSLITATATVDLTIAANLKPLFIDGERVNKIEIAAAFGGKSQITYITASGKRIRTPVE